MYILYKIVALSALVGLALTSPAPKITADSFDDLTYGSSWYPNMADEVVFDSAPSEVLVPIVPKTVEVVASKLPKLGLVAALISLIPKIVGLKLKTIKTIIVVIKWLVAKTIKKALVIIKWFAPKTIFMAIGAIAAFAFCKLTNLCSVAYNKPVVYDYVPSQYRNLVTPERLDDAQHYLMTALQQYAKH